MKKFMFFLLLISIISCKSEKVELPINKQNLVELKVQTSKKGFTLIYQVEQWNPIHDTLTNINKWNIKYKAKSGDLIFLSVLSLHENTKITTSIFYEGKLLKTLTRQNYYNSCYLELNLP